MSNNKITIVINTFKSEDKIHNCLKSIDNNFNISRKKFPSQYTLVLEPTIVSLNFKFNINEW